MRTLTADDTITVTINVGDDRDEAPAAPTVTVTSPLTADDPGLVSDLGSAENTAPRPLPMTCSTARAAPPSQTITVQPAGGPITATTITGTTTTITGLDADTSYSVQVRAKNDEGTSAWSRLVTVKTNKVDNDA